MIRCPSRQPPASRTTASTTNSLNRASLDQERGPRARRSLSRALTLTRIAARPGAFSHGNRNDHHPSPGGPPSHTSRIRNPPRFGGNLTAHKRVEIRDCLAANPRIQVHYTPTSGSWLNLVEVWFGIIERQAIHRGTFRSVRELNAKIRAFIDGWNDRKHPFVWTKTADEILKNANRQNTSNTAH